MSNATSTTPELLINGYETDTISALDRGLHYGDGLFETLAVKGGRPLRWERHLLRLMQGCDRLGIPFPDVSDLTVEAQRLCAGQQTAVLKVIVTRGTGGRGYRRPAHPEPTRILARYPWPDYPQSHWQDGVRVRLCDTRLGSNPALAGMKHLNRLEQVLARAEWSDEAIAEGLMFDSDDNVIEGTMCNLFLVSAGQLVTTELSDCGIAGIMRGMILECAESMSLHCEVRPINRAELLAADELLLCNSVIGIWPVRALELREYVPGTMTRRLMQALDTHHD